MTRCSNANRGSPGKGHPKLAYWKRRERTLTTNLLNHYACMHAQSLSCVWLFATLWTVAYQAPLSMEFSYNQVIKASVKEEWCFLFQRGIARTTHQDFLEPPSHGITKRKWWFFRNQNESNGILRSDTEFKIPTLKKQWATRKLRKVVPWAQE